MQIQLYQINKAYKNQTVLKDISLVISEGELISLLGPSGSGKTTLLKIISGLEVPDKGQIWIDNRNITLASPMDRGIGFVFQHYALFKHMSVFDNIAFGQRVKPKALRLSDQEITTKINELIELVQIDNLQDRFPHELSGGQRQRVALARALAVEPRILLLDEPFSALDAKLKIELRRWLRNLQKKSKITIILVTHDQEEALDVSDRIILLNKGQIEQIASPKEIYHSPCNAFVYNFLGNYNVFKAIKDKTGKISIINNEESQLVAHEKWYNKHKIVSNIVSIFQPNKTKSINNVAEEYFEIFVRPHDIEISTKPLKDESIEATITHLNLAGPLVKLELESPGYEFIEVELSQENFEKFELKKGDKVFARAKQITMFGND